MNPTAWQPTFATRLALRILARCSLSNSGKPYVHEGSVRCAVLASMRRARGLLTSAADSLAAASGRQRKETSASLSTAGVQRCLRLSVDLGK
jgi:hypothetical protein